MLGQVAGLLSRTLCTGLRLVGCSRSEWPAGIWSEKGEGGQVVYRFCRIFMESVGIEKGVD
jgi:hypothetical protein